MVVKRVMVGESFYDVLGALNSVLYRGFLCICAPIFAVLYFFIYINFKITLVMN